MGARALGAGAIGDAGGRDLASEFSGPRSDALRAVDRAVSGAPQASERLLRARRGGQEERVT